jgi:two-component system chemotaxis sensor kinase CheA
MGQIVALVEALARTTAAADAEDLPALAEIHKLLENLGAAMPAEPELAGQRPRLEQQIAGARKLVEGIILRELTDTTAAIKTLAGTVGEVQQLIAATLAVKPAAEGVPVERRRGETAPIGTPASASMMVREEDLPLVLEFVGEAAGHIEAAEAYLLKLDADPEDDEAVNGVFRSFHTIKGVAGFLNLTDIGALAHVAEGLLDLARKGKVRITGPTLDLVLEANDAMKRLMQALERAAKARTALAPDAALSGLIDRLRAAMTGDAVPVGPTNPPAATPGPAPEPVSPPAVHAAAPAHAPTPAVPPAAAQVPAAPANPGPAAPGSTGEATVKVGTDRLDKLINAVGELVIAQAMARQDMVRVATTDQRFVRNMSQLGKITRELQDLTMAMRMVPIQGVFQKMTRLIRDLARKGGKQIDLGLTGGETELDRNLVEALADPLVHMIRNAADHGIESPDERLRAGKDPVGHVELRAYQQAGNIVVEVRDDGRGLNQKKILAKAREAGLVAEGQELSEQDIFRLIFHPGLSTAQVVTEVSGRGVGMDVVRKNVEALRGRIDIASTEGKGSTFTIRLPLTLAVIDGLVVKVGPERYILPITSIEQSLRPKAEQISTLQNRGEMCMIRGQVLPVCRLHKLFQVASKTTDPCQALLVLVQDGARRACLLVDELLGQQQVVIKSLGEITGNLPGVSGGAILGDGTISLILDVPGLLDLMAST